jgi:5-methylcytosine-specific restriction endonuclease McrA
MSNTYGISEQDEREIRVRDKTCVYCGVLMMQSPHVRDASGATIEHFNNDGPFDKKYNVAICCRGCNSSKGTKKLSDWFQTDYCRKNKINEETVAEPVKEYLRLEKAGGTASLR